MKTTPELSRITIDIPKKDHKRLKALALVEGRSMREIVAELIEERLCCGNNIPNVETIEAMENIKKKQHLIKAKDAADLFKKLGI